MHRTAATHLSVLFLGLGLGIGAVAVADSNSPMSARSASASDAQIVRQLRKTNTSLRDLERKVDVLNKSTGGYTTFAGSPSLRAVLQDIERNTSP